MVEKPPIYGWGSSLIGCPIHRFSFDPWMGVSAARVHHRNLKLDEKEITRSLVSIVGTHAVKEIRDIKDGKGCSDHV